MTRQHPSQNGFGLEPKWLRYIQRERESDRGRERERYIVYNCIATYALICCIHIYVYMYIHIRMHMHITIHTHIHMNIHININTDININRDKRAETPTPTWACGHAGMWACVSGLAHQGAGTKTSAAPIRAGPTGTRGY